MLPFDNNLILKRTNAITGNIVTVLNSCVPKSVKDTAKISQNFKDKTVYASAFKIWLFVRENIVYKKDDDGKQIIQYPGALWAQRTTGGDCKSMSLFVSSLLLNLGAENVRLRYVSYNNNPTPTHVYTVFNYQGRTVPVDTVIEKFDYEKNFTYKYDYPMDVLTLSGINGNETADQLKKTLLRVRPGSLCAGLLRKQIARELGNVLPKTEINPILRKNYENRLRAHILYHEKNNKLGVCYELMKREYSDLLNDNVTGGIAGIGRKKGGFFDKLKKGAKKVALAPVRNAFLTLVALNWRGIASRISISDQNKIKKTWEGFGGNFDKLKSTVNKAKNKKALGGSGVNGIGEEPGSDPTKSVDIGKILSIAAPIIAAILKLLTKEKAPKFDEKGQPIPGQTTDENKTLFDKIASTLPVIAEGLSRASEIISMDQDGNATPKPNVEIVDAQPKSGFDISPKVLIFGGAALVGVLLLTRKK